MLTVALILMARNWKPSKCPSTGEWMNKEWWWNCPVEYYTAVKMRASKLQVPTLEQNDHRFF